MIERLRTRRVPWIIAAVLTVSAVVIVVVMAVSSPDGDTVRFDIPAGTADRLAQGQAVNVMPRNITLDVGDELVIANHDEGLHIVGPYSIRPDETLRVRYEQPGRFQGLCTVNKSAKTLIVVK